MTTEDRPELPNRTVRRKPTAAPDEAHDPVDLSGTVVDALRAMADRRTPERSAVVNVRATTATRALLDRATKDADVTLADAVEFAVHRAYGTH